MHLILIGLRGTGKSTAGRATADLLARRFVDLDERTADIVGCDAPTCFAEHGEAAWRAAEVRALRIALESDHPSILALGGGTPIAPGAEAILRLARAEQVARIAWLDAPAEVVVERIGDDPRRPALTELPPLEEMREIDRRRRPVFQRIADRRIDAAAPESPHATAALIALATTG
ncbi:MAG: shikimate kinase [Planctomycetota bacterium]|nr:shikimate kinase [Planctomycetota bacterium]